MDDAIDQFLWTLRFERHLSDHTVDAYGRDLRKLVETLESSNGSVPLVVDVTESDLIAAGEPPLVFERKARDDAVPRAAHAARHGPQ